MANKKSYWEGLRDNVKQSLHDARYVVKVLRGFHGPRGNDILFPEFKVIVSFLKWDDTEGRDKEVKSFGVKLESISDMAWECMCRAGKNADSNLAASFEKGCRLIPYGKNWFSKDKIITAKLISKYEVSDGSSFKNEAMAQEMAEKFGSLPFGRPEKKKSSSSEPVKAEEKPKADESAKTGDDADSASSILAELRGRA